MVKSKFRTRIVALVVTFAIILTSFVSSFVSAFVVSDDSVLLSVASADSNDRRRALINFARNKSLSDMTEDGLESLTNEDLTMIGVYLSNFYVPWSTSIQSGADGKDEAQERMVNALVSCNFNKDVAKALVGMVFKLSEETHQPLRCKFREKAQYVYENMDGRRYGIDEISGDSMEGIPMDYEATWGDFLYLSSITRGNYLDMESFTGDSEALWATPSNREFYWVDSSGESHTVFTINARANSDDTTNGLNFCAFTLQYAILSAKLNYHNGLAGNSLFMCSKEDVKNFSEDDLIKLFLCNAPLSIDCFGNIIADCGTEAFVIVPAATNPFVWRLSSTGKRVLGESSDMAGEVINMINLPNIGYAESGYVSYGTASTATSNRAISSTLSADDFRTVSYRIYTGYSGQFQGKGSGDRFNPGKHQFDTESGDSLFKSKYFTISRGDSNIELDTKWIFNDDADVQTSNIVSKIIGDYTITASDDFSPDVLKANWSKRKNYNGESISPTVAGLIDSSDGGVLNDVDFFSWSTLYFAPTFQKSFDSHVESSAALKGYTEAGVGTTKASIPAYTDLIMINTLGDLDAVADLYGTSVTDTPEPAEESELTVSELKERAMGNYNVLKGDMESSGVSLSLDFKELWEGLTADLVNTGRISTTSTEVFMKYVDFALSDGRPPYVPSSATTASRLSSIKNTLQELNTRGGIDAARWSTFCASLDAWRGDSAYSTESAIADADSSSTSSRAGDMLVTKNIFNADGTMISEYSATSSYLNTFSSVSTDNANAVCEMPTGMEKAYAVSIYLSYVYAYFGGDENPLSWEYNSGNFPMITGSPDWGEIEVDATDERLNELQSMAYWIMHPSEGIEYIKIWFKNKIGGILSGWHEDMAGASHTTATTGTTRYVGFMGYVTTPQLTDLSWTDWLLTQYDSLIVYFVILMMVILLLYVLVGTLSLQKAIAGVFIFAVCAFLPPKAINMAVDTSNRVCDSIYGSKFTYWALIQHEQYVGRITEAVQSGNNDQYLSTIFSTQVDNASDDYAIVTVKWMCPKKDNYMASIERQLVRDTGDSHAFRLISGLVNDTVSGEDYLDSADSLYLYRSYSDISAYANHGYKRTKLKADTIDSGYISETNADFTGSDLLSWDLYLQQYDTMDIPLPGNEVLSDGYYNAYKGMALGFEPDLRGGVDGVSAKEQLRYFAMLKSTPLDMAVAKGLSDDVELNDLTLSPETIEGTLAGISQKDMDFGLHDISTISDDDLALGSMSTTQIPDFVYANYTESPYYYFSYNLYDQLSKASTWSEEPATDYKSLFLASGENSYFYNMADTSGRTDAVSTLTGGYGQMRDYMDMRSLFCVVIPRLKQANDVVVAWDNTYGLTLYDDIPIKYLPDGSFDIPTEVIEAGVDSELAYKYWHNANVVQLFNMYTPWVDTMYDCDYAKPETILVNGEKFEVSDPLNPYSYFEYGSSGITAGRPMIFSRSEMDYFGLRDKDLTTVEKKIIEVQDNSYESLLQLMDYYNFNEEVLNTGAAMLETFEFNKTFSQTSVVGKDYILYPQSYELKNFSYDAYLRLMLANSTGESITDGVDSTSLNKTGSFYQNVVNNSSILTGIMLVVVDLFAVYAVPTLKIFFVVMLFILSILVILAASVSLEIRIQEVLIKSLVLPLLKYLGISIGMAFVVSLFMSDGNTAVTNRKSITISLGDPVMLLIAMLVINAGVLILYARLCKGVWNDAKKYFQAVGSSIVGTFGGALAKLSGAVIAGRERITSSSATGTEGGSASQSRTSLSESVRTPRAVGAGVGAVSGAGAAAAMANSSSGGGRSSKDIGTNARVRRSPNDISHAERMSNIKTAKANKYDAKVEEGRAKRERGSANSDYRNAEKQYKTSRDKVLAERKKNNGRASAELERAYAESRDTFNSARDNKKTAKYTYKSAKARYASAKAENRATISSLGKRRPRNGSSK